MVPAEQDLPLTALDVGHVNIDDRVLTDPIEAPDALLEQVRVAR